MLNVIQKVPIPTAGVALGLAALGNLLQPYTEAIHVVCGALAFALIALLAAKIVLFPNMIRDDLHNSILASVSATLFMTLMQLAVYLAPAAYELAFAIWAAAVISHLALMGWFTARFIAHFKLHEVFPTYFICYVGIVVASVTSPTFAMTGAGHMLFWFGFACYLVLLALVTYRYAKHEIPEAARPLFCIYTAPMSLSLVGYLATAADPNPLFVAAMLVLAQALFVLVLSKLPRLLRLRFYPSYAAMTFPFVITATALGKALFFFRASGVALPEALDLLFVAETAIAIVMVAYVFSHYVRFFVRRIEQPQSAAVLQENQQIARFSENFDN
ncbi:MULTISPECIES: TDT family transporter [unclassified Paraeggerthella]|uniref:TDT family transporter n=1 Tax=Paraeggerthella TaxID=651554 RepID=UPI001CE46DB3|nr:TDT family transporter [Paraeggerthella sp. Marseille-Q4926]MDY3980911.1 TDT family transporter [Paraeggerthella sp.]